MTSPISFEILCVCVCFKCWTYLLIMWEVNDCVILYLQKLEDILQDSTFSYTILASGIIFRVSVLAESSCWFWKYIFLKNYFETLSHENQAVLNLVTHLMITLTFWTFCFLLPITRFTDLPHVLVRDIVSLNPELCAWWASMLPTKQKQFNGESIYCRSQFVS